LPPTNADNEVGVVGLDACAMAEALETGRLTATALVDACLEQIDRCEDVVGAWTYLDPANARRQAAESDRRRSAGTALGPLDGVPVGVKDIFDTADMPTENGTVLHAGRRPTEDSAVVARLRAAGAIVMGKTVTTELAVYTPGKTRNPRDPSRSPGGSSSGSAAAVAALMVPLAVGSQTNGSVIRPAAYCGVVGYKPTRGLIPLEGVLAQSSPLDTAGVFARSVRDAALITEHLIADGRPKSDDPGHAHASLSAVTRQEPSARPRLAFVKTVVWENAEPDCKEAFTDLVRRLDGVADEVTLPDAFAAAIAWHQTIMEADLAKSFAAEYERGRAQLSAKLCEMIERGQRYLAVDYSRALDGAAELRDEFARLLAGYDAILTPATLGTAPHGLESTGSPAFCTTWTLLGAPAVTVPLLEGADDMPLGVQLVGAAGDDARLLRTARWLTGLVGSTRQQEGHPGERK
jgi:Asp-tRNA(Asn)/Glu-tRNA(Gln) amidotransferase A subunit family amidase